ncbi:MAG: hypoxanthine phosphoribosyltransferase [Chloroflexi bacterium]|nr:hypoxanthine phosphoribosyltransferase [Chloroflexota bacterium]
MLLASRSTALPSSCYHGAQRSPPSPCGDMPKHTAHQQDNAPHKTAPRPESTAAASGPLPAFAHPSEEEFANILTFYGIEWQYEPRSFPLRWNGEKVAEMFTPDFYLPGLNTYIEITTLKQNLVTEKNSKVRRLRELYPDIKIRLLYRRDYNRLLAKFGFGPLGQAQVQGVERLLFSANQVQQRVQELGKAVSRDYEGQTIVLVGVLKGVMCFIADLMRQITTPCTIEFMSISYYDGAKGGAGGVRITKDLDQSVAGKHILLVEDIVDTGMTLRYVLNHIATVHRPASLKVCALLDKKARRLVEVPIDYVGFEVPDEFVVGYGLDYQGLHRNLPFIGILRPVEKTEEEQKEEAPRNLA